MKNARPAYKLTYSLHSLLSGIALLLVLSGSGQSDKFTASVNKNPVGVNDRFSVTLTLHNVDGEILSPDMSDFILLYGPGTSTNIQIVNGKRSSSFAYTYTLKPKNTGTFTLGPFKAKTNGVTLISNSIELKVVEDQAAQTQSPNQTSGKTTNPSSSKISGSGNLIVKINLNKSSIYVGEAVIATFVLYSRYQTLELQEFEAPAFNGFWSEELGNSRASWDDKIEVINGMQYRRATLREVVLIPQHAGNIKIDEVKIAALVNASFFNRGSLVEAVSNAPVVKVKPLPDGKPDGFSGAVGTFTIKAKTNENEVKVNDAINYVVEVRGTGNLKLVNEFEVVFPGDFEKYDPKSNENISIGRNGMNGSKSWDYLLIPRHDGSYKIPGISFTYFDLKSKTFKTLKTEPIPITVLPGDGTNPIQPGLVYSGSSKQDFQLLDEDIRYINNSPPLLIPNGQYLFGSLRYFALFFAPALAFIGFVVIRRRMEDASKDVVGKKMRKAQKRALRYVKNAESKLQTSDETFYDELFEALNGYVRDKFNMGNAELTKQGIRDRLSQKNIEKEQIDRFVSIIETCEMARFAPIGNVEKKDLVDQTKDIIHQLEKNIA
jgi:hypothetical protein